jgi:pimeloyl-ACP methyl ester carboxylesterase
MNAMGAILLIVAALVLRFLGAMIRVNNRHLVVRGLGWVICTTAAWMVAGTAGAWFPLWPALALGITGALLDSRSDRRTLWTGTDVVVVLLSGLLSIPPLAFRPLVVVVAVAAGAGIAVDVSVLRVSKWKRTIALGLASIGFVLLLSASMVIAIKRPSAISNGFHLLSNAVLQNRPLYVGLTPASKGNRVVLETGAVAWLERPPGGGRFPGALLFHGAHPDGSRQSSAIVLRHALLDAGFIVLSVDHPGYGESPTPNPHADIVSWDPLPTALAALKTLRATADVDAVLAIGHSMGTTDVLRLLSVTPELRAAVLFGASWGDSSQGDPSEKDAEYWYERFHSDRRMREHLSEDRVLEIRKRFYEDGRFAQALSPAHAPILFVRFGFEGPDIIATRDVLYDAIPGRKMAWDFAESTHYFSSYEAAHLVVGDTRVTRSLASWFRVLASEFPDVGERTWPAQVGRR